MNPWENLKPPSKPRLIENEMFARSSRIANKIPYYGKLKTARLREETRVSISSNILIKHLNRCLRILESFFIASDFYKDIVKLYFPEKEIRRVHKRIRNLIKVIERLKKEYINKIRIEREIKELSKIRREAQGRLASFLKSVSNDIEFTLRLYRTGKKLPGLTLEYPVFIIAGAPNVGKSSLINAISTARVRTASYPFTTKEIHVGHLILKYIKVQLIDTPGLLDRPLKNKNPIEMQAIFALKHLPGHIIYLFDPSPSRYYEITRQINIYDEVRNLFKDKEIIPVVNKIDNYVEEELKRLIDSIGNDVLKISVLNGINIDKLKKLIIEKAKTIYLKKRSV